MCYIYIYTYICICLPVSDDRRDAALPLGVVAPEARRGRRPQPAGAKDCTPEINTSEIVVYFRWHAPTDCTRHLPMEFPLCDFRCVIFCPEPGPAQRGVCAPRRWSFWLAPGSNLFPTLSNILKRHPRRKHKAMPLDLRDTCRVILLEKWKSPQTSAILRESSAERRRNNYIYLCIYIYI